MLPAPSCRHAGINTDSLPAEPAIIGKEVRCRCYLSIYTLEGERLIAAHPGAAGPVNAFLARGPHTPQGGGHQPSHAISHDGGGGTAARP